MEINFKQKLASQYSIFTMGLDAYVTATTTTMKEISIPIYRHQKDTLFLFSPNDLTDEKKLYVKVKQINSIEDILDFCKKYGTLVGPQSNIMHNHHFRTNTIVNLHGKKTYLEEIKPLKTNPPLRMDHDFMWINHFFYYVDTIKILSKFEEIRGKKKLTIADKKEIFHSIFDYMLLIYDFFLAEYTLSVEGSKSYLKTYPFYYLAFLWHEGIDTEKFYQECNLTEIDIIDEENSVIKSEPEYDGLSVFVPIIKFLTNSFKKEEFLPSDIQCQQLFHQISSDIINFHLKDLPFSEMILKDFSSTDCMFQSLGDAIVFQIILDINAKRHYRKCANPYCNEMYEPTRENRRYCSDTCAHNVTNRKHMKNKRNAETTQNKEHQVT